MTIADLLLFLYLAAPALVGAAIFIHAATRPQDRIAVMSLCLLACSGAYAALAYELFSRAGADRRLALGLGVYAPLLYLCNGVLTIHRRRWAWGVGLGALVLHLLAGFVATPAAFAMGRLGIAGWVVFLFVGAVGLVAALWPGTRYAVVAGAASAPGST